MCSTNNGSDDGGVGGGEGGGGLSSTSKKPHKRQRVPKRGPGVAELEKILREQEKKTSCCSDHVSYFHHMSRPPVSSHNIDVHFLQMPPIGSPLPSMSNQSSYSSSFGASTTMPVPNSNHDSANSSTNVERALVRRCIGGNFLPERALLPVAWAADEGKSKGVTPLPSMKKKLHCNNPTTMMNNYLGSGSSSSNIPFSVGLCHQIEPPSSQSLCHNYPSIGPHDKVIGVKRPPPPPSVANVTPVGDYQVPQIPSHWHRPDQPTTSFNHDIGYNPNITKPIPRNAKWDVPHVEFNYLPNYNTELHGPPDGNNFRFLNAPSAIAVSTSFQTLQLQLPKFDHLIPFQGGIKELNQRPTSAGPDDQNMPFYSFLPSKETTKETSHDSTIESGKKEEEDDIDLNLKLSTS